MFLSIAETADKQFQGSVYVLVNLLQENPKRIVAQKCPKTSCSWIVTGFHQLHSLNLGTFKGSETSTQDSSR